jgi:L-methionine (R)-S-oxide reductase
MSITPQPTSGAGKPETYAAIVSQLGGLLAGERDPWANSANAAALLFASLPGLNWAGFYFLRGGELVVGPFQGKPACVRIALGRGVCGAAAAGRRTLLVPDVHAFADHIACDAASNSEVVVPIVAADRLVGVLDLDSPELARFDEADATGLERVAALIAGGCDWRLAGIDNF